MSELIPISQDVETVAQTANVIIRKLEQENEKLRLQLVSVRSETIEECAKIAESAPANTLHFWDRPGGPPGNGYCPTTGKDIASLIRLSKLRGAEQVFTQSDELREGKDGN